MADTRTGARQLYFDATYCPEDDGGCGQLLRDVEWDAELFPPTGHTFCPNCQHRPLAHVSVTTADAMAPK